VLGRAPLVGHFPGPLPPGRFPPPRVGKLGRVEGPFPGLGLDPPGCVEGRLAGEGRDEGRLGTDGFMPPLGGRLNWGRDDGPLEGRLIEGLGRELGPLDGRLNDEPPDGRLTEGRLIEGLGRELGRLVGRPPPNDGVLGRGLDMDPPLGLRLGARLAPPRLAPPRLPPPCPVNPAHTEDSAPARIMSTAAKIAIDLR
jgi:hypothetical protein